MKKIYMVLALVVIGMAGCRKRDSSSKMRHSGKSDVMSAIDIPMADEGIRSFFDEDIEEFVFADDVITADDIDITSADAASSKVETLRGGTDEFTWVEEDINKEDTFDTVYFDFDKFDVKEGERVKIARNAERARKMIKESKKAGNNPTVYVDGNSCHSAGSSAYNYALSEKRARILADIMVAEYGVPCENIKVIGRGSDNPAIIDGKVVTGSRKDQWQNRRDEMRVIVG